MHKILVTGSAGFIAPHIMEEALRLGWEVIGVDKEEVEKKENPKMRAVEIKNAIRHHITISLNDDPAGLIAS